MKILITGGCGFIGNNVVRHLTQHNHSIVVVDNFSIGNAASLADLDVDIHQGDILQVSAWEHLLADVDAIVHLAANTGVQNSVINPFDDYELNVRGTFNLLLAARNYGVAHFIFASSNASIGKQIAPMHENYAPLPISPYGASKLAGEGYCLAFGATYDIRTVVLRFANVYGQYSAHKNSVVTRFFNDAFHHQILTIYGNGLQTRDFIHAQDIALGIRLALENADVNAEIIQLGSGLETQIIELAERINQLMPTPVEIDYQPPRQSDIYRNYSDIRKAQRMLGFQPTIDLTQGLVDTCTWLLAEKQKING